MEQHNVVREQMRVCYPINSMFSFKLSKLYRKLIFMPILFLSHTNLAKENILDNSTLIFNK